MSIIFYVVGFSLTFFTIIDLVWTALWIDGGAGPLSDNISSVTWRLIKKTKIKLLSNMAGPLTLILTLLSWILFIWLGITIFFAGSPDSIINTTTNGPIAWYERFYFTGFTLFTLGVGDYSPKPGFFQIATAISSGLGMLNLTIGASYTISVISAVVKRREFSRSVSGIGEDSIEFIKKSWNGQDFYQLDLLLSTINSQISELTQQSQAFPLLQAYHSGNPEKASSNGIATLDEALTFLSYGLKDKSLVNTTLVEATRSTIDTYIDTILTGYGKELEEMDEVPPTLDLSLLDDTSIPRVTQEEFTKRLEPLAKRRRNLLNILRADALEWPNND